MEKRTWWIAIIHIIIINNIKETECLNKPIMYQSLTNRIHKALIYMKENLSDLNIDAYFGVLLANAQLKKIKINNNRIEKIQRISEDILKEYKNNNRWNNNVNLERHIINENVWENIVSDENYTLSCSKRRFINPKTEFVIRLLLTSNSSPDEFESDLCLSELMDNYNDGIINNICNTKCKISLRCQRIMSVGKSFGYSTSHRLLYWMFYRELNCCQFEFDRFKKMTDELCCDIQRQRYMIEDVGYPNVLRDLYIEQAVVCTMSGYRNLLSPKIIRLVMSWQRSIGCWGHIRKLQKRSTTLLGSELCSTHMTAVGTLFLVLALRDCC